MVIAVLPLVTALFGAWLAAERPSRLFWAATLIASTVITVFSLGSSGGTFERADIALLAAIIAAGFGYAEGARLARELGAWQTISWALLISVPGIIVPVFDTFPVQLAAVQWSSVAGFAYVSVVSMFSLLSLGTKRLRWAASRASGRFSCCNPSLRLLRQGCFCMSQFQKRSSESP